MTFNSWQFLIFLPVVVLLYWVLPSKFRWIMLLIASYLFYLSWNVRLIFLILFTTAVSYLSGLIMQKTSSSKLRKTCLIVTLICCLGVLFFFKYFAFTVNTAIKFVNLFGRNLPSLSFSIILPVGISFYTFQTLSYVIDVYRGKIQAERHLGYYALFVVYFPQLVAGPIERPENLIPQLRTERRFRSDDFTEGVRIAILGFFKKVVIADGVAGLVNAVYNNLGSANGLTVLLATVLFAIQIYCDFSGYTDIATGVARMMGIRLSENFRRPYSAVSIRDFWRRWHISLTGWFTDYVYIPLGGNRCKLWRWAINVMIVFLLSGLWHGASWTFVIWGGIHGAYQIIGKLKNMLLKTMQDKGKITLKNDSAALTFLRRLCTFSLVCFAWIFFRGNSLGDCGIAIAKLFTDWSSASSALKSMGFGTSALITTLLMVGILVLSDRMLGADRSAVLLNNTQARVSHKISYTYLVLAIAAAWIATAALGMESVFIYFQF